MATTLPFLPSETGSTVVPSAGKSGWLTVIEDGGLFNMDAANLRTRADITDTAKLGFQREPNDGTAIGLRILYNPDAATLGGGGGVAPIVRLFGKSGSDPWTLPRNFEDAYAVELPYDYENDPFYVDFPSTYNMTVPRINRHWWDCDNCTDFIVGVQRAITGPGGGLVVVQAKLK